MRNRIAVVCLAALGGACSSKPKSADGGTSPDGGSGMGMDSGVAPFPTGFLWSVSTAAEQSEGGNTTNDWYVFEGMGKVPPVGMADDMYDLYDTDFANAQAMGCTAFRLTFEWGRLVPTAPADPANMTAADFDPTALAHYHAVISSLKSHNLTPLVTLTHYTLPVWVDDPSSITTSSMQFTRSLGAWTSSATVAAFASYAGAVATEFGSDVTYWLTENEPELDLLDGYAIGVFPPGVSNLSLTAKGIPTAGDGGAIDASIVLRNLIAGHAGAYHAIHAAEPGAQVSIAHNSIDFEVSPPMSSADVGAEQRLAYLYNDLYLDAATSGNFDTSLIGNGPQESHPDWANTMDFIGLNYYFHNYVVPAANLFAPVYAIPCNDFVASALPGILQAYNCPPDDLSEPEGLTAILLHYSQRYSLPILITENGTQSGDPNAKAAYLVQNLQAVKSAVDQGAKVIGYSYWTLNDDYEWQDGYADHFGLYAVKGFAGSTDAGTPPGPPDGGAWYPTSSTDFTRVPYAAAIDAYAAITDAGGLPPSLIAQFGADGG